MIARRDIEAAEPGERLEVMWATGTIPLHAPARTGKVHFVTPESWPYTLCGRIVPMPSRQFHHDAGDPRCLRCVLT